jgi:hypothetical protein
MKRLWAYGTLLATTDQLALNFFSHRCRIRATSRSCTQLSVLPISSARVVVHGDDGTVLSRANSAQLGAVLAVIAASG